MALLILPHVSQFERETRDRERERALVKLNQALAERDRRRAAYEAARGTTTELTAYTKLRNASDLVAAWGRWLRWVEQEDVGPAPQGESPLLDVLIGDETRHESPAA
jgi:hypothetical protein